VQVVTREETTLAGFNSTTAALQSTAVTAGAAQINNAYGGRPFKLTLIDGGYATIGCAIIGFILVLF